MLGIIEPIILSGILQFYMKIGIPKMMYLVPMDQSQRRNYIKKVMIKRACIPVMIGIPGLILIGQKLGTLQLLMALIRLIAAGVFISELELKITHWISFVLLVLSSWCVCVIRVEAFYVIPVLLDIFQIPLLIYHFIQRRKAIGEVMTYEYYHSATRWDCNL